jgi:hypothetical protein
MTVDSLIKFLAAYPLDLPVMVNGYEGGLVDVEPERIHIMPVVLNYGRSGYCGPHEPAKNVEEGAPAVDALVLERSE